MVVSRSADPSVPRPTPIREIAPVTGGQAHAVGRSQGLLWHGIVADREIIDAVEVRRRLDERGDALLAHLVAGLQTAAAESKRARQYDLHSLLVDLAATAVLIAELDDAEDTHDHRIREHAEGSLASLGQANTIHAALLGQAGADVPLDLVLPWPLGDDAMRCGEIRPAHRPKVGEGLMTAPCRLLVGHQSACVFEVVVARDGGS